MIKQKKTEFFCRTVERNIEIYRKTVYDSFIVNKQMIDVSYFLDKNDEV